MAIELDDILGYRSRRVIVTGCASGMGEAVARILVDLGAEVHGIDIKEPSVVGLASFHATDLRKPEQIHATAKAIEGDIDGLFNCAGLPTTFPDLDVMLVNFCGLRELTELIVPRMTENSGVINIASVAGAGWLMKQGEIMALVTAPDFAAARAWCEANVNDGSSYTVSKEAINAYTALRGFQLAPRLIRMNCVNPGPTDTPMMPAFVETSGQDFFDAFPKPIGRNARPDEPAWALVLLNSPRASYLMGQNIFVDGGFMAGMYTGQIDPAALKPPAKAD
jgi:NAD(P)-dependent dehydrogenase (short-subunit alcohol dehydrogenase family)